MAINISLTSGGGYAGSILTHNSPNAGKWYANDVAIPGQTATTLTITVALEGAKIYWRDDVGGETSNIYHLFIPSDVSNLALWLDAYYTAGITFGTGSNVAAIASRVGSLSFAQATAANQPTHSATGRNSKPAFIMTTGKVMDLNTPTGLPDGAEPCSIITTAFASASPTSDNYRAVIGWGSGNTTGLYRIIGKNSTGNRVLSLAEVELLSSVAVIWSNIDHIAFTSMSSAGSELVVDGQHVSSNATAVDTGTNIYGNFGMGRDNDPRQWEGSVQEVLVYSSVITTAERQAIEGYMAHKWGLTSLLDASHPYKTLAPEANAFRAAPVLGALVGLSTLEASTPVAVEAVLGALETSATMVEIFDVAGDITLGALVGESTITAVTAIEVEGTLGALEGSSELTAMVHTEVDGTLGALIGESTLTQTLPPGDLEVLGFLGGLVGEAALTVTPEVDVVVEGLLGSLVGEAKLVIPENISVNIEAIFGGLIGESILDEDLPGWLEVEDGTIVPNANSYVRQDYVDNYLSIQGYTDYLAATQDEKQGAIVRATSALEAIYGDRYPGEPVNGRLQSLLWPRKGATDVDGEEIAENEIPVELKRASAEAAYLEWLQPGYLTPNWTPDQLVKSEKLGPLSVTYSDPAAFGRGGNKPTLAKIDSIMSGFLGAPNSLLFGTVERV